MRFLLFRAIFLVLIRSGRLVFVKRYNKENGSARLILTLPKFSTFQAQNVNYFSSPKQIPIFLAAATISWSAGTALSLPAISSSGTATTLLFTSATILP